MSCPYNGPRGRQNSVSCSKLPQASKIRVCQKYFTLQLGDIRDNISIDRLKPAYLDQSQPPQVAQPPRRGRPPKQQVAVPELSEVPEVQQPAENIGQEGVQNCRTTSCPNVPVKPSYADVVTSRGRVSRPTRRYLEVSACLGGGL